jgi:hypothetical protein
MCKYVNPKHKTIILEKKILKNWKRTLKFKKEGKMLRGFDTPCKFHKSHLK